MEEYKPLQRRITKFDLEDLEYIFRKLDALDDVMLRRNPAFKRIKKWAVNRGYWKNKARGMHVKRGNHLL